MNIKLIALDMDGTLLNSKHEISSTTFNALIKAKEKGIKIVLASGRPYLSLLPFIERFNLFDKDDYTICFNGSKVINNVTRKTIYNKTIPSLDMKNAFVFSKENGLSFYAYDLDETIIYNDYSKYVDFEHQLTKNPVRKEKLLNLDDNLSYIKITFTESKEKLDIIQPLIEEKFSNNNVVRSHDYFIEVINKDTSKGKALEVLLNQLNISNDECMTFGDNDNDLDMINIVKYGICMGNSTSKRLRKCAYEITKSNDEDGIFYILNKYSLI